MILITYWGWFILATVSFYIFVKRQVWYERKMKTGDAAKWAVTRWHVLQMIIKNKWVVQRGCCISIYSSTRQLSPIYFPHLQNVLFQLKINGEEGET